MKIRADLDARAYLYGRKNLDEKICHPIKEGKAYLKGYFSGRLNQMEEYESYLVNRTEGTITMPLKQFTEIEKELIDAAQKLDKLSKAPTVEQIIRLIKTTYYGYAIGQVEFKHNKFLINYGNGAYENILNHAAQIVKVKPSIITLIGQFYAAQKEDKNG